MRQATDPRDTPCGMNGADCRRWLRSALREDLGRGDITSRATIPASAVARGQFIAKECGIAAGLPLLGPLFSLLDERCSVRSKVRDGARVQPGQVLAEVTGPARAILAGERVALNLIQHLSGVATLTSRYVAAVAGTGAKILDTRKTSPGLRLLEKYAVRAGGGANHRLRLDDQVLIKDNHLALLGGGLAALKESLRRCQSLRKRAVRVEIEVRSAEEAVAAVRTGADIVMLDNVSPAQARRAAMAIRALVVPQARPVLIEASGGITLRNVVAYAKTGVDWISIGALTHSAPGLDISLEMERAPARGQRRGRRPGAGRRVAS